MSFQELTKSNKEKTREKHKKSKSINFLVKFSSIFQPLIIGIVGAGILAMIASIINTIYNNDLSDHPIASAWTTFFYLSIIVFWTIFIVLIGYRTADVFGDSGIFGALAAGIYATPIGAAITPIIFLDGTPIILDQTLTSVQVQFTYSFLGIYHFSYVVEGTKSLTESVYSWEIISQPGFFALWMIRGFHPEVTSEATLNDVQMVFNPPTGSIFGAILIAYIGVWMEKGVRKHMPNSIDILVSSFVVVLSLEVLNIILIIPISGILFYLVAYTTSYILLLPLVIGTAIISGIYLFTNAMGIHLAFTALDPALYAMPDQGGIGTNIISLSNTLPCAALAGMGLALYFRSQKNTKVRGVLSGEIISALFGISEPLLYGIAVPQIRPFFNACIASFIGGLCFGFINWLGMGIAGEAWFNPHNSDNFSWVVGYNNPLGGTDSLLAIPFCTTGPILINGEWVRTNRVGYVVSIFTFSWIVTFISGYFITYYSGWKKLDLS